MSSFEQFILTGLLLSHPHNYSDALRRLEKPITPRDVRRAIDYIEAHLDQAVTVADLVKATGVAGRTLFMHFKDFKGVSPMRYLRNARLRQVRQALLRAEQDASVTEIAMSTGFTHMGRFSVEYRRRFGETPFANPQTAASTTPTDAQRIVVQRGRRPRSAGPHSITRGRMVPSQITIWRKPAIASEVLARAAFRPKSGGSTDRS